VASTVPPTVELVIVLELSDVSLSTGISGLEKENREPEPANGSTGCEIGLGKKLRKKDPNM